MKSDEPEGSSLSGKATFKDIRVDSILSRDTDIHAMCDRFRRSPTRDRRVDGDFWEAQGGMTIIIMRSK